MKKTFIAILSLAVLAGCIPQRPKGIRDCFFHLADVQVRETALTYLKLELLIDITNPNGVEVTIDRMVFDLYANGHKIGEGAASYEKPIPPGESVKKHSLVAVDYFSAGAAIISMVKSYSASYSLRAKVYYRTPLGDYHSWATISQASTPSLPIEH